MDNTTEAVQPLQSGVIFHHAVMNLPASAVEFLDALYGSFDMRLWQGYRLPFIHVYTFARNDEGERGRSLGILSIQVSMPRLKMSAFQAKAVTVSP